MAKNTTSFRASAAARDAIERLYQGWGYRSKGEAIEAAVCCWEWALAIAAERVAGRLAPEEWGLLADVCNGTLWVYGHSGSSPGALLAAEVADGHRLNGAGYRWLAEGDGPPTPAERAEVDVRVSDLVRRLAGLEYAEAWAAIQAVRWFWQHESTSHPEDEWWRPSSRRGRDFGDQVG